MRTPSSRKCRLDLAPPLADRFILRIVPIDYGPVLLLMPFGFHLTVDTLPSGTHLSGGFRSALAVSSFRLRARLGLSIPSRSLRPTRRYPRFRIRRPSPERRRDSNPPEQCAAQRTLCDRPTPHRRACWTSGSRPSPTGPPQLQRRAPMGSPGSRAWSFHACLGSLTARSPADAGDSTSVGVAFRLVERRQHSGRDYFAAPYPACMCPCQRFDGSLAAGHA